MRIIIKSIFAVLSASLAVFIAPAVYASGSEGVVVLYELKIGVDLKARAMHGTGLLTLKQGAKELRLIMRSNGALDRVYQGNDNVPYKSTKRNGVTEYLVTGLKADERLGVDFHGVFPDMEAAKKDIKRGVSFVDDGVMGEEGAFLPSSSYWFPREEDSIARYDLQAAMPYGFGGVAEGEPAPVPVEDKGEGRAVNRWRPEAPLTGLDLVVGRYFVEHETHKGIDLYTFFFKRDAALTRLYMDKTKAYLDMYEEMMGRYPFKKFAVVEGILPTGYGMPSFTLLGSSVIRLPFIPDTSLGHEIAHNWWGNSVFVDDLSGNWSEAITTYTADYLYAESKGKAEAKDFRLSKLRGYRNFAGDNPIALNAFSDATAAQSRSVGYNKGAMVFHMLRRTVGDKAFFSGLKRFYEDRVFKKTRWDDIRRAFEKASDRDLGWFFEQWLGRSEGPELSLSDVSMLKTGETFAVRFIITQKRPAYIMTLPMVFTDERGKETLKEIKVSTERETISLELEKRPVSLEVDPAYDNFRVLGRGEMPPSLGAVLGSRDAVVILPSSKDAVGKYAGAGDMISKDFGLAVMSDSAPGIDDIIRKRPALILGGKGENLAFDMMEKDLPPYIRAGKGWFALNGEAFDLDAGSGVAVAFKNPRNPENTQAVFMGSGDASSVLEKAKKLRYFSQESYIVIRDGKTSIKGLVSSENALKHVFNER